MIVVYPFSGADQDLALKNAKWMKELGGCKGHQVLALHDRRCVPDIVTNILGELSHSFDEVHHFVAGADIDGWPQGANYFFRLANAWMEKTRWPYYLWMEPDAIPLTPMWLDLLEVEYRKGQRPFMGDRVQVENIPLHMSGVGFYPNPLHAHAGEAYRAAEVAWDMAGKDQIVPRAYFTKLIEHAWRHPQFHEASELKTQIRPETILFHSSKDGSLIDLLRGGAAVARLAHNQEAVGSIPTPATTLSGGTGEQKPKTPGASELLHATAQPSCDIFIRTYPGDYQWLGYCLQSIKQFARGFRKVWIVSPGDNPYGPLMEIEAEWKKINDETEDGYLAQQITKLYADVLTDYQSDYILHLDSDVILSREVTPGDFFDSNGKPVWYYTPYAAIQTPWQEITEKFMLFTQPYEFMRRFPMIIPRWLYPRLREFCHKIHGRVISEYIRTQPMRAFSEFNALGAYAYFHHQDSFAWRDTTAMETMPPPFGVQFHSWGGITPEVKKQIEQILHGVDEQSTVIPGASGTAQLVETPDSAPVQNISGDESIPEGIKELPNGLWVLKGDQISEWVEQEGRLDHDQNLLPKILEHINPGDIVIDAGAFIGDHTIAYLKAVGRTGTVYAFEPNPLAMTCLLHNVDNPSLITKMIALGNHTGSLPLSGNNNNMGGAYLGEHMPVAKVKITRLDDFDLEPDFIKLDIEGSEVNALHGMAETIRKHRPIMVIEINSVALDRQKSTANQILEFLDKHGYNYGIMQENCNWGDPLYDILCLPKQVSAKKPPEATGESPSVAALSPKAQMTYCIEWLAAYAAASTDNKRLVMQYLVLSGLKKPNPKNQKRNAKKTANAAAGKKNSL